MKTPALASAVLLLLAAFALPARAADTVPIVSTPQQPWLAAQLAVAQALDSLRNATTANKGGYVEKARADLDQVLADVAECLAFAALHPELTSAPVNPSPDISALSNRISDFNSKGRGSAPNLRAALNSLQTALAELQQTPRVEARDRLIGHLAQAGADLISGIEYFNNPSAIAPAPPPPPAVATTPMLPAAGQDPSDGPVRGLRFAPEVANARAAAMKSLGLIQQVTQKSVQGPVEALKARQVMPPIALYSLDLGELADGHGFKPAPAPTSYYYLVKAAGKAIAAVDVSVDVPGQERMRSVSMGLQMQLAEIAHDKLPTFAQVRIGSYEVRMLVEHVTLAALWLKSDSGDADLIYPVISFTPWLKGKVQEKLYTVPDFVKVFGPIAKESLAGRSQPWGGN